MSAAAQVRTPVAAIDRSFAMAVELVDHLRARARAATGRDGYYAVADGRYNPCPTWDSRDWDHVNKMHAYLWGGEPDLAGAIGANIGRDQLLDGGALKWCYGADQRGMHLGHYAKSAAGFLQYADDPAAVEPHWPRLVDLVRWALRVYDADGLGLIADSAPAVQGGRCEPSFWGYYIGEPAHFPVTLSPRSSPVIATMTFCALLGQLRRFAADHGLPDGDWLAAQHERVHGVLERRAWSERRGHYYLQYDAFNRQWYFSLNGTCEESRELLVIPWYADEVSLDPERARAVARTAARCLLDDGVFPMPVTYPFYRWYGASTEYHYHAFGMDRFLFTGCWDNPYHNCANLLASTGHIDAVLTAVRRRSEAACRDGDFSEWYQRDGSVGAAGTERQYHRDRYGVSATAHVASVVEALFGVRPALPGFRALRLEPAFPWHRPDRYGGPNDWLESEIAIEVSLPAGRRLACTFRCAADYGRIVLRGQAGGIPARVRLPVAGAVTGVRQGERSLPFRVERQMDVDFVRFEAPLDERPVTVTVARG